MQIIRNETPCKLELIGAEKQKLVLSPLEQRQFEKDDLSGFDLSEAKRAGLIYEATEVPSEAVTTTLAAAFTTAIFLAIICPVVAKWTNLGTQIVWLCGLALFVVIVAVTALKLTKSLSIVGQFIGQSISLFFILAIGFGLPALTIYYFGNGKALLTESSTQLFARLLQLGFIGTASLLPVLLFFLFDRYQLSTMRNRLYRDLFRLDHSLKRRSEIDVKYGPQIREAYGAEDQGRGRLARGTRAPVLVCAFVMTMGWLAAFKPIGEVSDALIQRPLSPERSALTFGFLGAYFFGLQLISRRYARGDLKPKAYSYVTIRIFIVAVLSWVLELLYKEESAMIFLAAFLAGIVPDEFFTFLKEKIRNRGPARLVPEPEKHPLTKLEGIDLYDRARLEQEGILNVESLAHHDLIQLVLETQIPVPRLVDWMDQAILYLHVVEEPDAAGKNKVTTAQKLRAFGIRTATDLLACWQAADARKERSDFKRLVGSDGKVHRLELIRDALLDDEWLKRVQDWRSDADPETKVIDTVPNTFEGKLAWAAHLQDNDRYREAIQVLQQAIEIRDDAAARVRLAQLYADAPVETLRNWDRSREHAYRAFELGSGDFDVVKDLAHVYETISDFDDAIRAIDRAIELLGDPANDEAKQKTLKALRTKRASIVSHISANKSQPTAPTVPAGH